MINRESMQCEVCNRILWVEDGPICVDCRSARATPSPVDEPKAEEPYQNPEAAS